MALVACQDQIAPGKISFITDGPVHTQFFDSDNQILYFGGNFTHVSPRTGGGLALDATTGLATAWNPNANGRVHTLAVSRSNVYAGGWFSRIGGQVRNNLAAIDAGTGLATAWDPNANMGVSDLAVSGTVIYAVGSFTNIGGQPRNRIAALDAATGLATAWNPDASNTVWSLVVSGTTVYIGGASQPSADKREAASWP